MQSTRGEVKTRDRIRHRLEEIPGVRRAVVNGPPYRVLLVCEAATAEQPLEAAARAVLVEMGVEPAGVPIEIGYVAPPQPNRRVRFVGVQLVRPHVGIAIATVQLEWDGVVYEGKAEGEGGSPLELRICGNATLRALETVLRRDVSFDLIGVKALRIFDHDLVAVLVHTAAAPERRLIGVSIVGESDHQATSLAVLNATNRLLGNFLTVG